MRLSDDGRSHSFSLDRVEGIDSKSGSYVLEGALVGLTFDPAVAPTLLVGFDGGGSSL